MHLILASASPRRREILSYLPIPFVVQSAGVDETPRAGEPPDAMVLRLSQAKAQAVACTHGDESALVLAADTTVALDGAIIGKPKDAADAETMLRTLRNRPHHVYTGITLRACGNAVDANAAASMRRGEGTDAYSTSLPLMLGCGEGAEALHPPLPHRPLSPSPFQGARGGGFSSLCRTLVHMRDYSEDELRAYIASASPFDKAGAYAIQDQDFHPVERIEGCYMNVMGLPLCEVIRGLRALGVALDVREPIRHDCLSDDGQPCYA